MSISALSEVDKDIHLQSSNHLNIFKKSQVLVQTCTRLSYNRSMAKNATFFKPNSVQFSSLSSLPFGTRSWAMKKVAGQTFILVPLRQQWRWNRMEWALAYSHQRKQAHLIQIQLLPSWLNLELYRTGAGKLPATDHEREELTCTNVHNAKPQILPSSMGLIWMNSNNLNPKHPIDDTGNWFSRGGKSRVYNSTDGWVRIEWTYSESSVIFETQIYLTTQLILL